VTKPKGGTAFITDFERKDPRDLLAITGQEEKGQVKPKAALIAVPPPAPLKKP